MVCAKCNNFFSSKVFIDGQYKNLQHRKHCLDCVPWGDRIEKPKTNIKKEKMCVICGKNHHIRGTKCSGCSSKIRRLKCKIAAVEYKGGKCSICGWVGHLAGFAFHHIDPTQKESTIAQVSNKKWETIKAELDKCILLCAICHHVLHADQENWQGMAPFLKHIRPYYLDEHVYKQKADPTIKVCKGCGKKFEVTFAKQQYCKASCYNFAITRSNKPTSEELAQLLWEKPTSCIAKDYGVSDSAVGKWAKGYGLKKPGRGYWTKMKHTDK